MMDNRTPIDRLIDQACGIDVSQPCSLHPSTPNVEPIAKNLLNVADAAKLWWLEKRPCQWSPSSHLHHPTINCTTEQEHQLARAVARWVELGG